MLVPTLAQVRPKPSVAMAGSARGSRVLAANNSRAQAESALAARISCTWPAVERRLARNSEASSAPPPAAPHSQPRVAASPTNTSLANTGSSTA
ncbi:hypothetical protein D3C75_940620 [compost metagenome]